MRLQDPAGLAVEVVHGLEQLPRLPYRAPRVINLPGEKRRRNAPQPNFGLIASDVELLPSTKEPLIAFYRSVSRPPD